MVDRLALHNKTFFSTVKVTATTQVISFAWVVHGRCNSLALGGKGREEKRSQKQ
jgi:hypothetical protein